MSEQNRDGDPGIERQRQAAVRDLLEAERQEPSDEATSSAVKTVAALVQRRTTDRRY
jgi:hypothetical protein